MKSLDDAVDAVTRALGLDEAEVAKRFAFLDISDQDAALVRQAREGLQASTPVLVEHLQKHLYQFADLRSVLEKTGTIEHAATAQKAYFDRLCGGEYGPEYVRERLRIGVANQRIGLELKWYLGAYRKYVSELLPVLTQQFAHQPEKILATLNALLKLIFLDMSLTLDTYFQAGREEIIQIKNYAEQIVSFMPSGLMVIDSELQVRTINLAMCKMLGLSDEPVAAGTALSAIVHNQQLTEALKLALASGAPLQHVVLTVEQASGPHHLDVNISTSLLEEKSLLVLIGQDITESRRSQEELRRFRMALDSSIDAVYLIDHERMRIIDANETALATLGYSRPELLTLGPHDLKPDEGELDRIKRRFEEVIASDNQTGMVRTEHQRKDGSRFAVEVYLRAMQSEGRQLLVAVSRDITARLEAETRLRESEERFRVAFSHAAVGLAHIAPNGRWLIVNQKLCEIVGYSQKEMLEAGFLELTHPEDVAADLDAMRRMQSREVNEDSREKRYRRKNGQYVWVNRTSRLVWDEAGNPKYYSTVIEDISRRKLIEGELLHLANHDALTSLPNRSLLLDRLSQAIAFANRYGGQVAVMMIDLDRFKNINDSLGHEVGDKIIIEIGRRLSFNVRDGNTVARLGGDEFVVMLADVERDDTVAMQAQRILESMSQPMTIQGNEFYPAGSIGISLYPKDGSDGLTLLKNADTAMYRAKDSGRNNFQFYAQEMNARALDRLKLEGGLRHALVREEFVLHYQPKMDIASGVIVGVEALLRWQAPGKPMIMPLDFIPIAEETGLIVQIGEWVLRTACAQQVKWESASILPQARMAVNLSARQFKQQDIAKMVSRILEETGCRAERLELEITETVILDNPDAAAATMQELSNMGVHLSIDDFGTGYSSLSYLKRFPIDALKIDRSFVRDITTDADDAAIARAIIALGHSMKLLVIAEGVETAAQLDFLREQHCDQMQGYYLSRPLPVERLEDLVRK
ncbi:hypothetical protein BH11PSE11_BH11PSE11_15620 [soil metagenome]